jgi:hypothetical protein
MTSIPSEVAARAAAVGQRTGVRPRAYPTLPRNRHRFRSRSDVAALSHMPAADPFQEARRAQ